MESQIPLPTDNIYKFYALFGLLLIIFGAGSAIYVNQSTNNFAVNISVEYATLAADTERTLSENVRFDVIKKQLDIAVSNRRFFMVSIGIIMGFGIWMMGYGFKKWHSEIQPIQDEVSRLSLLKLKRELGLDDGA